MQIGDSAASAASGMQERRTWHLERALHPADPRLTDQLLTQSDSHLSNVAASRAWPTLLTIKSLVTCTCHPAKVV